MHALKLLHTDLRKALPAVHLRRLKGLLAGVEGLLVGGGLWLSEVGRHVPGRVAEKHKIKRVDRLLGNHHLHQERASIYRWLTHRLLGATRHPCILVDWSDVDGDKKLFILRAAVAVGGRALPLYEAVYDRYHHRTDQRAFLAQLAHVLPPECVPVIVTDAGFRGPWFRAVAAQGWYYLGRVRNRDHACFADEAHWFPAKTLYSQATATPRDLGQVWLGQTAPLLTRAVIYRKRAAGRHRLTVHGERRRNAASEKHAHREREPWLLVTNRPPRRHFARQTVAIYRDRMTIEQGFRDLKAHRHGFAFRHNLGRNPQRVANLLLIAAVATLVLWITGIVGIQRRLDRRLQANTEKRRRVLSVAFVGKRLLQRHIRLLTDDLRAALQIIQQQITQRAIAAT